MTGGCKFVRFTIISSSTNKIHVTIIRQIDNALWVEYTDADGGYFSGMLLKEVELSDVLPIYNSNV